MSASCSLPVTTLGFGAPSSVVRLHQSGVGKGSPAATMAAASGSSSAAASAEASAAVPAGSLGAGLAVA